MHLHCSKHMALWVRIILKRIWSWDFMTFLTAFYFQTPRSDRRAQIKRISVSAVYWCRSRFLQMRTRITDALWLQTVILICKPVWPMFDSVPPRLKSTFIWKATWNECPISGFSDYDFALINKGPNAKPAEDPRANIALARTNWLHSKYKIVRPKHLIFCFII